MTDGIVSDDLVPVVAALAVAISLAACHRLAKWHGMRRTLRAAARIASSYETEQALAQAGRALRGKIETYRLAKVRANLGASSTLHAAATELVREHRLHLLERK